MAEIDRRITQFFSALADETRLKILLSILDKPKTVNDIYSEVGRENMTLSAISHQLRQMNDMGMVAYEKKGRERHFRLSDNFCWCILRSAMSHFGSKAKCEECSKKLRIKNSKIR
ncbi:transcriptional regulator [Candidatus Woesearchaeota archaeon CG10_big_fil_rev_8_21_14_0_10_44_13]|nr:MAG: transcriptional regulator [Candidatus Woesearchaeota archaeon CG10_big_fil_rev_8_21_14_0_10_44_13]